MTQILKNSNKGQKISNLGEKSKGNPNNTIFTIKYLQKWKNVDSSLQYSLKLMDKNSKLKQKLGKSLV